MAAWKVIRKAILSLAPGIFFVGYIASCATTPPSIDKSSLEKNVWFAVRLQGRAVKEEADLTLRFSGTEVVNGDAACNKFFAPVKITAHAISFGLISATERLCESPVKNIDKVYFAVLKKVRIWEIDADTLLLKNGDGMTLIEFHGRDWRPIRVCTVATSLGLADGPS